MNITDDFMTRYLREYDFYIEAARLCAQQCEVGLEQLGIRAIVTHRAKRPDRLAPKLQKRNEEKKYTTIQEIYKDIVDLAGVRIALYFPGDRPEVQRFVETQFQVNHTKAFPEIQTPKPGKRFTGYWATHHRVQLKDSTLSDTQKRFAEAPVEIQVASVLMHAWAEVEHDLVYKPFSGALSETEYAILDQLNGLILSGEIALETLQRAVKTRVSGRTKQRFNNHYELAAYLYGTVMPGSPTGPATEPVLGRVDVLYRFLQLASLDRPDLLKRYLVDIDPDTEKRSVSDQLVDRILSSRPEHSERYLQWYIEARRAVSARSPYAVPDSDEAALGYFMSRWIAFESVMNALTSEKQSSRTKTLNFKPVMDSARHLLDYEFFKALHWIRQVRNHAIHAVEPVDAGQLYSAGKALEPILERLVQNASPEIVPKLRNMVGRITPLPEGEAEAKVAQ